MTAQIATVDRWALPATETSRGRILGVDTISPRNAALLPFWVKRVEALQPSSQPASVVASAAAYPPSWAPCAT